MKKLFFILSALLMLFLSCDPHNTENSINIRLDKDTVNKILSTTSARFADPKQGYGFCLYAVLKGNNGSRYEKSIYYTEESPIEITNNGDTLTFNLSDVSYRENYDLYIYIVQNGTSTFSGLSSNIELNKYGPTYVTVDLKIPDYTIYAQSFRVEPKDSNTSGNYLLTASAIDEYTGMEIKTEIGSFGTNAPVVFTFEASNSDDISYDFYIIHNGKQTNLPMTSFFNGTRSYEYTITTTGTYTAALRKTDLTNNVFATYYMTLTFKDNSINTNYVIYNNNYGTINVWETESLNESGILSTSINYDNTSANTFDFCLTSDSDIFVTDGNTVFRNWDKNNTNNNISANGRTLKSLSFDMKRNFIISYGLDGYTKQVGIANVYSPVYSGFSWKDDPKKNTNLELQYAAAYDGIAYLFYTERNASNSPISYTIYVYAYQLNEKSGQYTPPEDDNPIKAYKVCYFNYNDPGNFYPSFKINDAVVVNGNLYFLISCYADGLCYNLLYDFGFTGKINLSTNQISITGHNCTSKPVNDYNYYNTTCFDFTDYLDYYGKNTNTLKACINPQKIIAIKPKSLIISDDGKLYWSDILDANDPLAEGYERNIYRYKNLNRVVTVELDSFGITDVKMLNNISWKNEPTTNNIDWACGSFIYTPN